MTKRNLFQIMQDENTEARDWLQFIIDIARAGDMRTLASTVDAADQWLHRGETILMSDEAADCVAMVGWAGAGAEASDAEALEQMREMGQ